MKIKCRPEDFKVEEIIELKLVPSGKFKVYLLEKKGIETFSLFSSITARYGLRNSEIGFAGIKDKHAHTLQYITVPKRCELKSERDVKYTLVGYSDTKIENGDLTGNKFKVVVRQIFKGELEGLSKKAEELKQFGVPNYFDSQRFGSVIDNKFIGKYLVLKDYESAVKLFLTMYTINEPKLVNAQKDYILNNWHRLETVKVGTKSLQRVIDVYRSSHNFILAYKAIPSSLKEMYIYAYQSYLWNECVKEMLISSISKKQLFTIPYAVGKLIYYKDLDDINLPSTFVVISHKSKLKDYEKSIVDKVLSRQGLVLKQFDIVKSGNFFKSSDRAVVVRPANFSLTQENDELHKNCFKITLEFSLPKGSYATVITKRLFNQ